MPMSSKDIILRPDDGIHNESSGRPYLGGPNVSNWWNVWMQRGNREVTILAPGLRYEVVLDLSRYQYRLSQSLQADSSVMEAAKEAVQRGEEELILTVRPTLAGIAVEAGKGFKSEYDLKIRLDRLGKLTMEEEKSNSLLLTRLQNNEVLLPEAAAQLQAGQINVPITTTDQTGCAQVIFSISDERGIRPLDHIVYTFGVQRPGQGVVSPSCEKAWVQGGLSSLSAIVTSSGEVQADAALHIVEFYTPTGTRTMATFVDSEKYLSARKDSHLLDRGVYTWFLQAPLQDFLGENRELQAMIARAHKHGNNKAPAERLALKLFPPGELGDREPSMMALRALKKMPGTTSSGPLVLIRAVTARGQPVYVPLALLATHDACILGKRPTVVQPLPREWYWSKSACVDHWTLGVPDHLDGVGTEINLPISSNMTRLSTLADIKDYLLVPVTPPVDARGEGFVILAHQGGGKLWATENGTGEVVDREEFVRKFARGSVAIFAACEVARPTGDNMDLALELNIDGVDAMVASPFPIESTYGIALTKAFVSIANDAYQHDQTPTLEEMFNQATDMAALELMDLAELDEKGLEFVLLGDQSIRLCHRNPVREE